MEPVYLGDGVYVAPWNDSGLKLYTHDGIDETNAIFLEPEVLVAFTAIVSKFFKDQQGE